MKNGYLIKRGNFCGNICTVSRIKAYIPFPVFGGGGHVLMFSCYHISCLCPAFISASLYGLIEVLNSSLVVNNSGKS